MSLSDTEILAADVDDLAPPPWVVARLDRAREQQQMVERIAVRNRKRPGMALVSVRIADAVDLAADEFEQRTVSAYQLIRRTLAQTDAPHPVRFWNHLPGIHQQMDAERDRYMVFNAGRFRAFADWFGGADQFAGRIATASGVGHRGTDLVIHCLATAQRGKAVENPRQIPAFRYSKKYGPLPPCFARATIADIAGRRHLLVGGTASICGEQTVHRNVLASQMRETLANLSSLVRAADESIPEPDALAAFTQVRIYHPRKRDAKAIAKCAQAAFVGAEHIELHQADLCRSELLVEIEGVAALSS